MSWTVDLVAGLAAFLDDRGPFTWAPTARPAPDAPCPIFAFTQPAAPDICLTIASYPLGDSPALSDTRVGVQLRSRGTRDPRTATEVDDAAFELLHGLAGVQLSTGVWVVHVFRQSGTPLGIDGAGRPEIVSNYYVDAARPGMRRE